MITLGPRDRQADASRPPSRHLAKKFFLAAFLPKIPQRAREGLGLLPSARRRLTRRHEHRKRANFAFTPPLSERSTPHHNGRRPDTAAATAAAAIIILRVGQAELQHADHI